MKKSCTIIGVLCPQMLLLSGSCLNSIKGQTVQRMDPPNWWINHPFWDTEDEPITQDYDGKASGMIFHIMTEPFERICLNSSNYLSSLILIK